MTTNEDDTRLYNVNEAAERLGLSRRKFMSLRKELGLEPERLEAEIYPRWTEWTLGNEVVVAIAQALREFNQPDTIEAGRNVGRAIVAGMNLPQARSFHDRVNGAKAGLTRSRGDLRRQFTATLAQYGYCRVFGLQTEMHAFGDGLLAAANDRIAALRPQTE